ncbi:MAG: T9SS type A sorting domain-containing protein [Bacteroidota bacterium]
MKHTETPHNLPAGKNAPVQLKSLDARGSVGTGTPNRLLAAPTPAYGVNCGNTFWEIQSWGGAHRYFEKKADGSVAILWQYGTEANMGSRMAAYNRWKTDGTFEITDATQLAVGGPSASGLGTDLANHRLGYPSLSSTAAKEAITMYTFPDGSDTRMSSYTRNTYGGSAASNPWTQTAIQASPEALFQHTASNSTTIHSVSTTTDVAYYPDLSDDGIVDAFTHIVSNDGGLTWTGHRFDTLSLANGFLGTKTSSFDMDVRGNVVAAVVTAAKNAPRLGTDMLLFKSTDNGLTWKTRTIETIDVSDPNNVTVNPTTGAFSAYGNDGAYCITIDNSNKVHVAVGRGYAPLDEDGSADGSFYQNGGLNAWAGALKYWNESSTALPAADAMDYIAYPVDVDYNGQVDLDRTTDNEPGSLPHGGIGYPTVCVDPDNNIYVLYTSVVEGTHDADNHPLRDNYLVVSRDNGTTWSPPLNVAKVFGAYDDGSTGSGSLEEAWPVALRNITDGKFRMTSLVDAKSGANLDFTGGVYTAETWGDNGVAYFDFNTVDALNAYISANFPAGLCGGTAQSVSFVAPTTIPAGSSLVVQLDTSAEHAFNPANAADWLTLGTYTTTGTSGSIAYTLPAVTTPVTGRIRVFFAGTDNPIISREYEVLITGGRPGPTSNPTASPSVTCFNNNNAATFTAEESSNSSEFVWTLTPSTAGRLSPNGTSATVFWNSRFTGGATISVYGVNGCGVSGEPRSYSFSVLNGVDEMNGSYDDVAGEVSIADLAGPFVWYVNGVEDPSQTGDVFTVPFDIINEGGQVCGGLAANPVCKFCADIVGGTAKTVRSKASLYPNPATSSFSVLTENMTATSGRAELFNAVGQKVMDRNLTFNTEKISTVGMAKGFYNVRITTADRKVISGKLVIE